MKKTELLKKADELLAQELQGQTAEEAQELEQDKLMSEARFKRAKDLTQKRLNQQLTKTA